jgi:hypothetical protein
VHVERPEAALEEAHLEDAVDQVEELLEVEAARLVAGVVLPEEAALVVAEVFREVLPEAAALVDEVEEGDRRRIDDICSITTA